LAPASPSLSTPHVDNGGSFPWAKALAMSPQQPIRQLSAIPDTEIYEDDLFPGSVASSQKWFDVKPGTSTAVSFADSGLGLSFQSTDAPRPGAMDISRSKPMAIAGSLPIRGFKSMASVFGKKRETMSKSWSDLWDEEEEGHAVIDIENDYLPDSNMEEVHEEHDSTSGVTTARNGLCEMKNAAIANNSRSRSPKSIRRANEYVSQQTGFIFEEHTPATTKYSPPPKRTVKEKWAAIGDKWAALGDKRRGQYQQQQQQQQTPHKPAKSPMKTPKQNLATPNSARKRSRTGSWRRSSNVAAGPENHGLWKKPDWNASKDWRQHPHEVFVDDIGDLEWVGGWNDLHL